MNISVNKNIVQYLLKRLYLKQKKSIYYDALLGKSSYKLDVSAFSLFGKDLALSFINKVILQNNNQSPFIVNFNDVNTKQDYIKSVKVVDTLKKIYHQQNSFSVQQNNSFIGVGYPLIVLKTKEGKLKVAPLIIWPILLVKNDKAGQSFKIIRDQKHSCSLNHTILSSLENYKDASLNSYMKSFTPHLVNKDYLASYCEGLMKYLNPNQEDRKEGYYGIQYGNPAQIKKESYYKNKTGASIWFEWSGVMSLFEFKYPHFTSQLNHLSEDVTSSFSPINITNPTSLIPYLDDEQSNVLISEEPLNVVTGSAGTGKTDVLCAKISQLSLNSYQSVVISQKKSAINVIAKRLENLGVPYYLKFDDDLTINQFKKAFYIKSKYNTEDLIEQKNKLQACELKISTLENQFLELQNIYEKKLFGKKNYAQIIEELKSFNAIRNEERFIKSPFLSEEDYNQLNFVIQKQEPNLLHFLNLEKWKKNGYSLFKISSDDIALLLSKIGDLKLLLNAIFQEKKNDFKEIKISIDNEFFTLNDSLSKLTENVVIKPTPINALFAKLSAKKRDKIENYHKKIRLENKLCKKKEQLLIIEEEIVDLNRGRLKKIYFTDQIKLLIDKLNDFTNQLPYFDLTFFDYPIIDLSIVDKVYGYLTQFKEIKTEDIYSLSYLTDLMNKHDIKALSIFEDYKLFINDWMYASLKKSIMPYQQSILSVNHQTFKTYQTLKKESVAIAKDVITIQYHIHCKNKISEFENESSTSIYHLLKKIQTKEDIFEFSMIYPHLFKAIFPVLLTSPENNIFQHLHYDVLFLEEASQLKLEKTYSSLFSHQQIFVFGDEKQMPPYDFFETQAYLSEEISDEDKSFVMSESILDFVRQLSHTHYHLNKYYRSTSANLIQFSNKFFYDNKLVFPFHQNNETDHNDVVIHQVDGKVENGVNVTELDMLLSLLLNCNEKDEIGVITLNKSQRNAMIEILIKNQLLSDHISVMSYDEVQGKEFDSVFISFIYGFDDQNWGVLNRFYADRILNVLFTRAKRRLIVITSVNLNKALFLLSNGEVLNVGKKTLFTFLCARKSKPNELKMINIDGEYENKLTDINLNNTYKSYKNVIFKLNFLKSYKHIWSYQKQS